MTKTLTLRSFDIPALHKFGIGFDNMFDDLMRVSTQQSTSNYPPYNIVQINEDEYMISLAVAGFGHDNLSVTKDKKFLIIEGKEYHPDSKNIVPNYLHKGISNRDFRREFQLADHVEISNAHLELGILSVHLRREVPEDAKPKTIAITYTA
ncbi:Hsp20 family protein [Haliscomenobacter sp.]|uniref:Hsp20 family protein n=1 Tax=Haliscomenobacter sp. TaxID=2717303 RepID=UPI003364F8C7